jgi:acetyl-CoA carboxylase biotin carboxyl carrier protein
MSEIEVEEEGFRVRLSKHQPAAPATVTPIIPVSSQQPPIPSTDETSQKKPAVLSESENMEAVTSPMVGTYYNSASPGASKYVEEGDEVTQGQVLCIIEAMKVMNEIESPYNNEIESPYNGKIISALVENAQPVEYGEALFLIKPNL